MTNIFQFNVQEALTAKVLGAYRAVDTQDMVGYSATYVESITEIASSFFEVLPALLERCKHVIPMNKSNLDYGVCAMLKLDYPANENQDEIDKYYEMDEQVEIFLIYCFITWTQWNKKSIAYPVGKGREDFNNLWEGENGLARQNLLEHIELILEEFCAILNAKQVIAIEPSWQDKHIGILPNSKYVAVDENLMYSIHNTLDEARLSFVVDDNENTTSGM